LHISANALHSLWNENGQEIIHEMNISWMTTIMRTANGNNTVSNVLIDEFYCYRKQMGDIFNLPMAKEHHKMQNPVVATMQQVCMIPEQIWVNTYNYATSMYDTGTNTHVCTHI
jgi:hypothetical protein